MTRFEQATGHIAEEKDLAATTSQLAGLKMRAEMLRAVGHLSSDASVTLPTQGPT